MKTLSYTCQFCGSHRTAEYDETCPTLKLEVWQAMLVCNPCADFETRRRKIGRKIAKLCEVLKESRERLYGSDLTKLQNDLRGRLNSLTRGYSRLLSEHYRKPELWDDEFVNLLMDKPDASWKVLNSFRATFAKSNR